MSVSLPEISAAELAMRIALRHDAGDWLALLVTDRDRIAMVVDEVQAALVATGACAVARISCPADAEDFIRRIGVHPNEVVLVSDLEDFSEAEWGRIDLRRSELARSLCSMLISTRPTLERMLRAAPNLASWVSGSLWSWQPDEITQEENERRRQALRSITGRSDEEVLQLAQARRLPRDPGYAEWLVLLGRGDLL